MASMGAFSWDIFKGPEILFELENVRITRVRIRQT